jgi:acyl-CoA thioesterase-1
MLLVRPETLIIGNKTGAGGIFYYVIVRYAAPFFALILTVSCSDRPAPTTSDGEDRPASAGRSRESDSRRVIVAFGDSLTAGFGAEPGKSYPDYLQREIDRKRYPWRVVNAGISGDTTTDGLTRLPLVLAEKPDIVILELGANDGLRGLPIQRTKANLQQMIDAFKRAGARVVLAGMTLPPNYGPDYIRPFENMFKDLAGENQIALIPFLLAGVGGNGALMQSDGLHPTAQGNQRVAANVMSVIEPMLK